MGVTAVGECGHGSGGGEDPSDLARAALRVLDRRGAGFGEVYLEWAQRTALLVEGGQVEQVRLGREAGAGVQAVWGDSVGYAYTDRLERRQLVEAAEAAARVARAGPAGTARTVAPGPAGTVRSVAAGLETNGLKPRGLKADGLKPRGLKANGFEPRGPEGGGVSKAAALPGGEGGAGGALGAVVGALLECDRAARGLDASVVQVTLTYSDLAQEVAVHNSQGLEARDHREHAAVLARAVARRGSAVRSGLYSPGLGLGSGLFERFPPAQVGAEAARRAVLLLEAGPAPAGPLPVVVASGRGGVLIHEACMHGLEADLVARESSVYSARRGERVASGAVSVVDDPTVPLGFGSYTVDDEGCPARPTAVVEAGVLRSFLCDRRYGGRLGPGSTGNGRRASFRCLPLPRMSNTFILPGGLKPDEVIAATDRGFYARYVSGGEVNEATGDFVFAVVEGYLIEGGRITRPVYEATVAGNGPQVLRSIDMVAGDTGMAAAFCEKAGQRVPISVGCPTVRVREMVVGGTAL